MAQDIKLFELDANRQEVRTSARGKYLETAFLLLLYRRWYGKLILDLKNYYTKQQSNHSKTLTDMQGLMVVFAPMRVAMVTGGHNKGFDFGNVATNIKARRADDNTTGRKREFWKCFGDHIKSNFLNLG